MSDFIHKKACINKDLQHIKQITYAEIKRLAKFYDVDVSVVHSQLTCERKEIHEQVHADIKEFARKVCQLIDELESSAQNNGGYLCLAEDEYDEDVIDLRIKGGTVQRVIDLLGKYDESRKLL